MAIPWGPYRPDVIGPGSGFAQTADGVIPKLCNINGGTGIGYGPAPNSVTPSTATALATAPRGNISLTLSNGTWNTFVGTDTTIQQLQADYTWLAIATGLNPTAGDDFSFAKFGAYLLNTNTTDGFKAYNLEAPAGNNAVSGAPSARQLCVSNNVVFAFDCDGNNRRMQSSGVGDYTAWSTLGADGKTFEDGGALICGRDLKNGAMVVFQESAMRLVTFGPAPDGALYTISKVSDGIGSVGERSVVAHDGTVYWYSDSGFKAYSPGGAVQSIGANKIDATFAAFVDLTALAGIQGAVDTAHKAIKWRVKRLTNVSTTVYDTIVAYYWELGEWATETVLTSSLTRFATPGYTLEQMDVFGTLDTIAIPLDDPFWQGGSPVFAGTDGSYKVCTFSGGPMAATLETCVVNSPVTGLISWGTPLSDNSASTLELGVKDKLSDSITWKAAATKQRNGAVGLRGRGMNIAFRENHAANDDWSFSNGIDGIKSAPGGPK